MNPFPLALVSSLAFLAGALEAVRRRHLREQYAVLWVAVGLGMLLLTLTLPSHLLARIASAVGVAYPPDLLIFAALVFAFALQLHLTAVVSRIAAQTTRLVQEVALLKTVRQGGSDEQPPRPGAPTR